MTLVTPDEALRDVRGYAAAGRIRFASHARQRMAERGATVADIRHALSNATSCEHAERGRWRVTGKDLDEEELVAVVVLEAGVVVVTIF